MRKGGVQKYIALDSNLNSQRSTKLVYITYWNVESVPKSFVQNVVVIRW